MQEPQEGDVRQNRRTGERAVFRGGQWWSESAPASTSAPAAGAGFTIQQMETPAQRAQAEERVYDRQRDAVRDDRADRTEQRAIEAAQRSAEAAERSADVADRTAAKLTEDQGKSQGYAKLMADAERSYQVALDNGFDPTGFSAGAANFVEGLPLVGGLGSFIRNDAGDRARQAELQWTDAQLKAMSGAASPEQEVARNNITFFARPGQNFGALGERLEDARQVAFESAKVRGGQAAADVFYPETDGIAPPTVNDGRRVMSADDGLAVAPGEYAASYVANFDRNGDNRASVEEMQAAGWSFDYDAGKWMPPSASAGSPPRPPAGPAGAPPTGGGMQAGIEQADQDARGRLPGPIRALAEGYRNLESFAQGAAEQLPGLDEAAAWTAAKLSGVPYSEARQVQGEIADFDRANYRTARNVGGVSGAIAPLAIGAGAPLRVVQGATRGGRAFNAAAGAGSYGAAVGMGMGDGSLTERVENALIGAGASALVGPLAQPVANALSRNLVQPIASRVQAAGRFAGRQLTNALGDNAPMAAREAVQANPLASGLDRFADRMGAERINALAPRAASRRDLGVDATLIDTLDDASVGRIRALATRDTPARDQAVRFAEGRRANLPSRATRIAREEISTDTRPAMDILDAQKATRRSNASTIQTFANDPVPVSEDLIAALRSDFVKPQLRAAAQRAQGSINPADREAANRLNQLAEAALDNPNGVRLTVREAQDISRALNEAADSAYRGGSPDGPVLKELANAVRGSARDNSQGYAKWLKQYGEDSDLIEAATTGRNFVSVSNDPINARSTEAFVRNAEQVPEAGRDIMRAASREAVEVASSNPSGARTTLDRFASDTDQARRAQALGVNPDRLRARAQAEIDALTAAQRSSPRVGSESSTNVQDAAGAGGMVINAIRRPLDTAFGAVVNRVASRGFSDAEAEAIVTAAQNPGQTDELIRMLSQRMNRRDARNMARAIRYQVATGPQSIQQR